MAVGADRTQVPDRVHQEGSADGGEVGQVVDVDVLISDLTVFLPEVQIADGAAVTPVAKASLPGLGVSLVPIHHNSGGASFWVRLTRLELLRCAEKARKVLCPDALK